MPLIQLWCVKHFIKVYKQGRCNFGFGNVKKWWCTKIKCSITIKNKHFWNYDRQRVLPFTVLYNNNNKNINDWCSTNQRLHGGIMAHFKNHFSKKKQLQARRYQEV